MGEELQRGTGGPVTWLRPSPAVLVDEVIDLTEDPADEMVPAGDQQPPALDRGRLFTTDTDRLIGTGDPEPRDRPLGGKRRRRFPGRR